MSITFDEVFERTIGHEGGYVNNPKDPGGETNWGITIKTARDNGYTGSMKSMSRLQAKEIYRVAFWNRALSFIPNFQLSIVLVVAGRVV